jgi:hypothetical protein
MTGARITIALALAGALALGGACKRGGAPEPRAAGGEEATGGTPAVGGPIGDPFAFVHEGGVMRAGWTPDGRHVIATAGFIPKAHYRFFDAETGRLVFELEREKGNWPFAISPDGRVLATGTNFAGPIQLWDLESRKPTRVLEGHGDEVNALCFLDGGRLVSGADDGVVRIWDVASGETRRTIEGRGAEVSAVACARDGRAIAFGTVGGVVGWLPLDREEPVLRDHGVMIFTVAISPDGRFLAAGGFDPEVRLWRTDDENLAPRVFDAHDRSVLTVAFTPDGRQLLTAGGDGVFRIWDPQTGNRLRELQGVGGLMAQHLAISPDGRRFVSWKELGDGVCLRDLEKGALLLGMDHCQPRADEDGDDGEAE